MVMLWARLEGLADVLRLVVVLIVANTGKATDKIRSAAIRIGLLLKILMYFQCKLVVRQTEHLLYAECNIY